MKKSMLGGYEDSASFCFTIKPHEKTLCGSLVEELPHGARILAEDGKSYTRNNKRYILDYHDLIVVQCNSCLNAILKIRKEIRGEPCLNVGNVTTG